MENRIGDARREYASLSGKFTQEDAADYFGVSLSTYKKWEQGQGMMNGSQLRDIAEKYGVTVDYLLMMDAPAKSGTLLSAAESELVSLYRSMPSQQREILMETARTFAQVPPEDNSNEVRIA